MSPSRTPASALVLGSFVVALAGCSAPETSSAETTGGDSANGYEGGRPVVLENESDLAAAESALATRSFSFRGIFKKFSLLRIVHASPDAPAVDVYVRGLPFPILRGVKFTATTPYLLLPEGSYTLDLRASPSRASDPVAFSTGSLPIDGGLRITAVATGLLGSKEASESFRVLPLVEDFAASPAGTTPVRVVHASPDAPTVDLDVGNDDAAKPELAGLARFADTGAAGVPLPSGAALQLGIAAGGKTVTAFTTPALPERRGLFVIATGLLGKRAREANGFGLLAVGPRGTVGFIKQNPRVYALHASPDAPAVDIFAGSAELVGSLSFGQISKPVQVPPGAYTLDFFAAKPGTARPAGAPAASAALPTLEAGGQYVGIATGFLAPKAGEPAFRVVPVVEGLDVADPSEPRVQVVHASPNAPAVDVGLVSSGTLAPVVVSDLSFGDATDAAGLAVPAGTLPLGIAPAGSTSPVASFDLTIAPSTKAIAVAAGSLDPSRGKPFQLLVVGTSAGPFTVASVAAK